jgi:hypothetical protein
LSSSNSSSSLSATSSWISLTAASLSPSSLLLSNKQKDAKVYTMRCSLTPLTNQCPRTVLKWPLGLGFGPCRGGGGGGRTTPRAPLAVGIRVVCPIERGPTPTRGRGSIIQFQLMIVMNSITPKLQLSDLQVRCKCSELSPI